MNASDELRSLSAAGLNEVSGAKTNSQDLGILGTILIDDNGCWEYRIVHGASNGRSSWQTSGACPAQTWVSDAGSEQQGPRSELNFWGMEAPLASQGIAPAHRWLVDDVLADGRLVAIMPDYEPSPVPLSLLIVPESAGIARVRLLVHFLAEQIAGVPRHRAVLSRFG